MTRHTGTLEIDRPISQDEAMNIIGPGAAPREEENASSAMPKLDAAPRSQPIGGVLGESKPATRSPARLRRILFATAALAVLGAGAYYGEKYWTVGRFWVSTDDGYVQADNTTIAPKVAGYLSEVLVGDNQAVKAGQVLARIDDRDYKASLDQANADVEAAQAAISGKLAAIDAQQSAIASAEATVGVDQANQAFAEQENERYEDLATTGYGTVQNAQQAASRIAASRASTQRDNAALSSAVKQVALLQAELAEARAVLARDEAARRQAELNVGYTEIVSPVDGIVGNRSLRVGQYVQAGTQLMAVVPSAEAYVVANFKETQLTDVHRGQPVDIDVDMFPGRVYHGHVDSLAPASGQTFALLPPDNATGNFTKIVQRIPVKIVLDPGSLASGDLRPGMSVTSSIDTKANVEAAKLGSALD